jgi:hypothetical protein
MQSMLQCYVPRRIIGVHHVPLTVLCNGEKQYCHCCHCTVLLLFCDLSCTGSLHQTRSLHHPIASQLILESFSALLSLVRVYPPYSNYPLLVYQTIVSANCETRRRSKSSIKASSRRKWGECNSGTKFGIEARFTIESIPDSPVSKKDPGYLAN